MKKLFILFALFLQAVLSYSQIEIRLVQPGGEPGIFRVQYRSVSSGVLPTSDDLFTDMSFRIWWNDPAIVDIDVVTANTYAGMLTELTNPTPGNSGGAGGTPGMTVTIGFCDCPQPNYPTNWVVNQWVNVATVTVCSVNNCSSGTPPAGIDASDFLIQLPFQFYPNLGITFTDYTPNNAPLPLNLISFKANTSGEKDALLSWTTANEENTSHFIVQRSFDKNTWTDVNTVGAAGYSIDIRNYELLDLNVNSGRSNRLQVYYRLKMYDLDGKNSLSPIQSVVFNNGSSTKANEFLVYPNPASDGVQIEWDADNLIQPTSLEFYDVAGKLIHIQKVSDNTNQEYIDFAHTNIQAGLYLLRIMSGSESIEHKQIVVGQNR